MLVNLDLVGVLGILDMYMSKNASQLLDLVLQ